MGRNAGILLESIDLGLKRNSKINPSPFFSRDSGVQSDAAIRWNRTGPPRSPIRGFSRLICLPWRIVDSHEYRAFSEIMWMTIGGNVENHTNIECEVYRVEILILDIKGIIYIP